MALFPAGWRCLRQVALRHATTPRLARAGFHNGTAALEKSSRVQIKGMSAAKVSQMRASGAFKKSGGSESERPKPVFKIGERKQMRDRIVLSNTNAPNLMLPEMTAEMATHELAVGTVFSFSDSDVDRLRALEAFRRTQDWKYFHRPSTVMRQESLIMGEKLQRIQGEGSEELLIQGPPLEQKNVEGGAKIGSFESVILTGPKGSGKSVLLLQTMAWALQKKWIVISIPNAQDLVIGHTEYEFDHPTGLWAQRVYTAQLLTRVAKANRGILSGSFTSQAYKFGKKEIEENSELYKLAQAGAADPAISQEAMAALLGELEKPGRPPVLFAMDNVARIMLPSEYRDTEFNIIHAHDLWLPNTFLKYMRGERKFGRGLILGVTCDTGTPRTEAFDHFLRGEELDPYSKLDRRIAPSVKGAEVAELGPLSKDEGAALLEYCRKGGLLREPNPLNDEQVVQRMMLSAGIAKDLIAGCVRIRT